MINRMYKPLLLMASLISFVVILPGCMSEADLLRQQGQPPAYVNGFDDGCHSGKKAGGSWFDQFKKDVNRFGKDKLYSQGWTDGFRQCETEEEAMLRNQRMALEYQKYSEQQRHNKAMESEHFNKEILKGVDTRGLENLKAK